MERLQMHGVRVAELLNGEGIQATVIKGMHTAYAYFPTPEVRPLTDIDIVVPPSKLNDAELVLSRAGYVGHPQIFIPYQCAWMSPDVAQLPKTLLYVHADDPWAFDLQTTLNRHLNNRTVIPLDTLVSDRTTLAWPLSSAANVLGQPLLTLQLAAHASQTRISLTLVRLVELVLVIRNDVASGALSWPQFLIALQRLGPRFVYPALAFCEQLAPGTVPAPVLSACEADAPPLLRRFVSRQTLSTLQGLEQHSLVARYMWVNSWANGLNQLFREIVPPRNIPLPLSKVPSIYLNRLSAVFHLGL